MRYLLSKFADFVRESDKILLTLCLFATSYGCLAVLTSTRYMNNFRPFLIQTAAMLLGLAAAAVISLIDYERFIRRWYLVAAGGLIPVLLTFVIGFAPEGTDDKAWLDLGFTTFQPSELLKISFLITFSYHLSKVKKNINKPKYLIPLCLHGVFPVALIHFQGDDGTALVFAVMMLCMMWAAGVSWKYFATGILALVLSSPIIYFFIMNDEQRERIISIFNIEADIQGAGFQQWRGRVALANGGLIGQGFLNGDLTQRGSVPMSHNDFIFVSIGEELGFLGCLAVLILLGAICLRCIRIAKLCVKDEGKYICVGMFAMFFIQTVINVGMCTSVLPVIGVTLPLFSAGGTSLLCLYLGIGLVLSVYMHRNTRTIYLRD